MRTPSAPSTPGGVLTESLLFALPDARQAHVSLHSAALIRDRLWTFGILPGAATAAVRISEALWSTFQYENDVAFTDREVVPLLKAAEVDPPTWNRADNALTQFIPAHDRERLLAKCDELLERFSELAEQRKLRSLIADIERLRQQILITRKTPS